MEKIFDVVKEKASKCASCTQLCAVVYPWLKALVEKYASPCPRNRDAFFGELDNFKHALAPHVQFYVQGAVDPCGRDLSRWREYAIGAAVDMALAILDIENQQISINLSAIMARFVDGL